ncbi:MAG: RsfS/YbeB/iojap family protein [Clostridia bacterium]|nr:RsfS/YbeB/iojap family protein [Clostridia bacterium]
MIDLEGLSSLADYFVVCSGRSTTQVKALVDYLDEEMEKLGVLMMRQEGKQEGRWA